MLHADLQAASCPVFRGPPHSNDFHLARAIHTRLVLMAYFNPQPSDLSLNTMSQALAQTFRRISISLLVIMIMLPNLHAKEQAIYGMEARRQSIVNLTRHIKQREDYLKELRINMLEAPSICRLYFPVKKKHLAQHINMGDEIIRHLSYFIRRYSVLYGVNVITFSIT